MRISDMPYEKQKEQNVFLERKEELQHAVFKKSVRKSGTFKTDAEPGKEFRCSLPGDHDRRKAGVFAFCGWADQG